MRAVDRKDPFMDEGLRLWIINTARKNHHRVKPNLDLDDLIQEGFMCYAKVRAKYPELSCLNHPTKGDRKWMQSLVQTTFSRHIIDLSHKRKVCEHEFVSIHEYDDLTLGAAPNYNPQYRHREPPELQVPESATSILAMVVNAPEDISRVILAIAREDINDLLYLRKRYIAKGGSTSAKSFKRQQLRETTNEYLCRLAGVDPSSTNMVNRLRDYFA